MDAAGKQKQRARRREQTKRSADDVQAALEAAMSLYSLTGFKPFRDSGLDTHALLAWNQDTAVLAFRGTASLTNALSDLKVLPLIGLTAVASSITPRTRA